jgi:hypothetical protein
MFQATLPGLNRAARAGLGPNINPGRAGRAKVSLGPGGPRAGTNDMVGSRAGLGNKQI